MNNQQRRLAAHGGRRNPTTAYVTVEQSYTPINSVTGQPSLLKRGGEYVVEKVIPASQKPKQIGSRFFYDQTVAIPERPQYAVKSLTRKIRVAV